MICELDIILNDIEIILNDVNDGVASPCPFAQSIAQTSFGELYSSQFTLYHCRLNSCMQLNSCVYVCNALFSNLHAYPGRSKKMKTYPWTVPWTEPKN